VQPGLRGSRRNVESGSDLGNRQVAVEAQRDHDLVLQGKRFKGSANDVALDRLDELVARVERDLVGDVGRRPAPRPPLPVSAAVDDDLVEPGFEPAYVAKRIPRPPRGHERVMGRVLRLGRIPQDRVGQPVGGVEVLIGQRPECRRPVELRPADGGPAGGHVDGLRRSVHDDMTNGRAETFNRWLGQTRGWATRRVRIGCLAPAVAAWR
jgi:hypothetical protein